MNRIVFLGTPDFSVPALKAIVLQGYEVTLVVTQKDKKKGRGNIISKSPVKAAAEAFGIDVYQPVDVNSKESLDLIRSHKPDFIVVIAYGQILSEEFLLIPQIECLNIHASLLPKYRGAAPINWAIIKGETQTGIAIMKVEKGLDSGPIYKMESICLDDKITAGELHDILMHIGARLIIEALEEIKEKEITPLKQDSSQVSYAPKLNKSMSLINWNQTCRAINNLIRGLDPWPGSVILYDSKKIKIFDTSYVLINHGKKPGTIIGVDEEGIRIACRDGYLMVREIQLSGKRRMTVKQFLLGNIIKTGYQLGDD
ncbi:MAG: Methionyl-tRNA formyltransferase [Clostridiales bacterium 38_11]|nr:MAG: Methionyl-tRNA formyltransferase [Clostridiales bacterium 38_11]HBH12146.1 methionyl-tRNA formyltransferase [Clostridiales bacterium]